MTRPSAPLRLVVMGVSGCGKSTVARALATSLGLALLEGDDFHAPASIAKMRQGVPLTDEDRAGWLDRIAAALAAAPAGAVASCSALKRSYRSRLREAVPGLRFVFLDLPEPVAQARVAARSGSHFFPPSLVAQQFVTLETPTGEPGVCPVDATSPESLICAQVRDWL